MAMVGRRVIEQRQVADAMAFHATSQHAILAATHPVYHHSPVPAQDIQPDRPIGYGAFGVVW